jgi:manganese oxidase
VRAIAGAAAALLCLAGACEPALAAVRTHYIAADEILWNYAPQQRDVIKSGPLPSPGPAQLGWTYHKAVYREYTDQYFDELSNVSQSERYRGLVGPTIHAEAGDTIVVVFKNRTRIPVDIAPAGLPSTPKPGPVMPGATRTFRWSIGSGDGPAGHDASSVVYVYESDVNQNAHENAGLIGPLVVTRKGAARADGSPNDVDQEIVTLFSLQEEDLSALVDANLRDPQVNPRHIRRDAKTFASNPVGDNTFATINGYVYGNMPMPVVRKGSRVRWYLLATKNLLDFHAPTWDGQTVLWQGNRVDTIGLAAPHAVVDMTPDDSGVWLLATSVNVIWALGMEARYRVQP